MVIDIAYGNFCETVQVGWVSASKQVFLAKTLVRRFSLKRRVACVTLAVTIGDSIARPLIFKKISGTGCKLIKQHVTSALMKLWTNLQ